MEAIQIKNKKDAIEKFGEVKKQLDTFAKICNEIEIKDDSSNVIAINLCKQANDAIKSVEELRKKMKEPYLLTGKLIDSAAKDLCSPVEEAIKNGKQKILEFTKQQEAIREKQISELQKISNSIDKGLDSTVIVEQISNLESQKNKGIRKDWDYEIGNFTEIPDAFKIIDSVKVRAYINENKDNLSENEVRFGIKFIKKDIVVLR